MDFDHEPNEPLLSDDETSALLDAMREEERQPHLDARPTELGAVEGPLRSVLKRADVALGRLAKVTRTEVLRLIGLGVRVEPIPADVVPQHVLASELDPTGYMVRLHHGDELQGVVWLSPRFARFLLERSLGADDESAPSAEPLPRLSPLDRRILEPLVSAIATSISENLLGRRELRIDSDPEPLVDASVKFEPMLRMVMSCSQASDPIGDLVLGLTAPAVVSAVGARARAEHTSATGSDRNAIAGSVAHAEIEVSAVLGVVASTVGEVLRLDVDDVLRLDSAPDRPLGLVVDDVVVGRGHPVVEHGNLALALTELV